MIYSNSSIIIGKGNGISKYLSINLGFKAIAASDLKNINLTNVKNIIYTSCNPSHNLDQENISSYLNKNIRNIYYILESNFKGSITYISSIDSGSFNVRKQSIDEQIEDMFTPYSFSKFSAEGLFMNHTLFKKCSILRVGLLWPAKENTNFYKAVLSNPKEIGLSFESEYFITPYSLVLKYIKNSLHKINNKFELGYLASSNTVKLSTILKIRNIDCEFQLGKKRYCYKTKDRDLGLINLVDGEWYNWQKEKDFNKTIAEALCYSGKEDILPFWTKTII